MSELIYLLVIVAIPVAAFIGMTRARSAHEDKLDRRAMYNEVLRMQCAEFELGLRQCRTTEEQIAYMDDKDGEREKRNDEILERAKNIWGIQ